MATRRSGRAHIAFHEIAPLEKEQVRNALSFVPVSPRYHYFLGFQCFMACMAVHSIDTSLIVKPRPRYEPKRLATPTSDSSLSKLLVGKL